MHVLPRIVALILFLGLLLWVWYEPAPAEPPDEEPAQLVDLRGEWRFHLGDEPGWAAPRFDDRDWDAVTVPGAWEDAGFWGYDGYAWYRRRFELPARYKDRAVELHLGRIDDVGEVYVNGYFVGSVGRMPPEYQTGYYTRRTYRIPPTYLNAGGENVVAVRVFDREMQGGLLEWGRVGLAEPSDVTPMVVDLAGRWQFRTGDDPAWQREKVDDDGWTEVTVPGRWEPQGFYGYDGYGWYRKSFYLPDGLRGEKLALRLGKIDDLAEVFLNGRRLGGDASIDRRGIDGNEWQQERRYDVPPDVLRFGADNVLAVRVFDGLYDGGIYEGTVGLVRRDEPGSGSPARWLDRLKGE